MTGPTLSKRWSEILVLAGLQLVLTASLVTGLTDELCGNNTLCGYGTKCENTTNRCKCLSVNDELRNRTGNPNTLFYCLGEAVTQCGDQLCGYRAECDAGVCRCSHSNDLLKRLEDTSLHRMYCVELCSSHNRNCSGNTTCKDLSGQNGYLCGCSAGARRSSAGQCLGKPTTPITPSTLHFTTEGANRTQVTTHVTPKENDPGKHKGKGKDDSHKLIIALAAGIGGAFLVAVIVFIVAVIARKRKRRDGSGTESLRRQSQRSHQSRAGNSKAYESVVDPVPGLRGTENSAGPTVVLRTEVSIVNPSSKPGVYEDDDKDFGVPHSPPKVTDKRDKCGTDNIDDLYSKHAIPANSALTRKQSNLQDSSDNVLNQYNTLYELTPTNGNVRNPQPEMTGNKNTDEGTADYSATYSTVGARGGNTQPASTARCGDFLYDELKIPKV